MTRGLRNPRALFAALLWLAAAAARGQESGLAGVVKSGPGVEVRAADEKKPEGVSGPADGPGAKDAGAPGLLVGANAQGVLEVEAHFGLLDERLQIRAPEDRQLDLRLRVSLADPLQGQRGDTPASRSLGLRGSGELVIDALAEEPGERERLLDLAIPKNETRSVRLVGTGFVAGETYRARLAVEENPNGDSRYQGLHLYYLQITSTESLGLRTSEVTPRPATIPAGGWFPWTWRGHADICVPVDRRLPENKIPRVTFGPASDGVDRDEAIPATSLTSLAFDRDDCKSGLALRFTELRSGTYASTLRINGEELRAKLTLRHGLWLVPVVVLLGTALSTLLRDLTRFLKAKADNEGKIRKAQQKLRQALAKQDKVPVWYELRAWNALRRAQGRNRSPIGVTDVDEALGVAEEQIPDVHEPRTVERALFGSPLPASVRRRVTTELEAVLSLSSARDEESIGQRLRALEKEAAEHFGPRLAAWLEERRSEAIALERSARRGVTDDGMHPPLTEALARAATRLRGLWEDARYGADTSGGALALYQAQGLQLEHAAATQARLAQWVSQDQLVGRRDELINTLFCRFEQRPVEPLPPELPSKVFLNIESRLGGGDYRVLDEVLLEVESESARESLDDPRIGYLWKIGKGDGKWEKISGGRRLGYVFENAETQVLVEVFTDHRLAGEPALQHFRAVFLDPPQYEAMPARLLSYVLQRGVILGAAFVAGLIAVGLYWSDGSFGNFSDYAQLLGLGLGVDVGLSGGAALVVNVVKAFGGALAGGGGSPAPGPPPALGGGRG